MSVIWEWLTHKSTLSIASAIGGGFFTHIFYKLKLKFEQRIRFQNTIGDEIIDSLREIRSITKELLKVDVYDVENEIESKRVHFRLQTTEKYPSFMNDKSSFFEIHEEILTLRARYANNIDQDVAVYLLYAEKYFSTLLMFAAEYEEEALHDLGTIFIHDIHKWQMSLDKILVNRINKPPLKLELHTGSKWRLKKKLHEKKIWKKTILYKVIYGIHDASTPHAYEVINWLDLTKKRSL